MRAPRQILPILLITMISLPVFAQRDRGRRSGGSIPQPPRAQQDHGQPNRRDNPPANNPQGNTQAGQTGETRLHGPGPHNGDWLRRFGNMPEQEQRRQLQSDPNFQRLPQDRQKQLIQRLDNYNRMSPEQKERVLQRMETWEHYSPEQRARARQLFQKFRQFDPDSRQRVTTAVRRLQGMPPDARQNFYNSDAFRANYNEDEQNVIRGLGELGPAESEAPEPPNK